MYYLAKIEAFLTSLVVAPETVSTEEKIRNTTALEFFDNEIIGFLQRAILCGEHYKNIIDRKVAIVSNLFNEVEIACQSTSTHSWKGGNIDQLMQSIQKAKKSFFEPFAELTKMVQANLIAYDTGKERENFVVRSYKGYFLKEDLFSTGGLQDTVPISFIIERIYRINVLLAYIDEDLHCTNSISEDLSLCKEALEIWSKILSSPEIVPILKDKIEFLDFKIKYRYNHPRDTDLEKDESNYPAVKPENVFFDFYQKTKFHYQGLKKKTVAELKKQLKEQNSTALLQLEPYHHLKRYYRKRKEKLLEASKEVHELHSTFDKSIAAANANESQYVFDRVACKTIDSLLMTVAIKVDLDLEAKRKYATIFQDLKLYIKPPLRERIRRNIFIQKVFNNDSNERGIEYLTEIKNRISELSKVDQVQDFHANLVFLDFLTAMIRFFKSSPEAVIDFDKDDSMKMSIADKRKKVIEMIEFLNHLCDEVLANLNAGFKILVSHRTMPAYLTMKECHIDKYFEDSGERLFIRTSYILPHDLIKIETKIRSLEVLLMAQKNALKDIFEIALNQAEIKSGFTDFEKRIKENEIKIVQIVGLFVTIATFILTNVKIFEGKSGFESLGIVLGIMASFLLFNLFIYLLVLPRPTSWKQSFAMSFRPIMFLLLLILLGIGSYEILKEEKFKANKMIEGIQKKLDSASTDLLDMKSLQKQTNQQVDSLTRKVKSDSFVLKRYTDDNIMRLRKLRNTDTTVKNVLEP